MEQYGASYVGRTSDSQLISSMSTLELIAATIVGNAAATYTKGLGLRNGANGLKIAYTNAIAVTNETVGAGDGSTTTYDLDHSKVVASSLKVWDSAGKEVVATLSAGTGAAGVDQIVCKIAVASGNIKAAYDYHSGGYDATGACVLAEDVTTTVGGGNVITNGIIAGNLKSSLVLDSAGVVVDQYFKDALPKLRLE